MCQAQSQAQWPLCVGTRSAEKQVVWLTMPGSLRDPTLEGQAFTKFVLPCHCCQKGYTPKTIFGNYFCVPSDPLLSPKTPESRKSEKITKKRQHPPARVGPRKTKKNTRTAQIWPILYFSYIFIYFHIFSYIFIFVIFFRIFRAQCGLGDFAFYRIFVFPGFRCF